MSDLNKTKTRDELVAELDTAKATYDGAKVGELEAAIKEMDEKKALHDIEMKTATEKAEKEEGTKISELTDLLQDEPHGTTKEKEETGRNTIEMDKEAIREDMKKKLENMNEAYMNKFNERKNATEKDKARLEGEVKKLQAEVKANKEKYEKAKEIFMGNLEYNPNEPQRISTRRIRFFKKRVENGVVSYIPIERLQFSTIKRRMTMNKLVKKMKNIGNNPEEGVKFVMGARKNRFMRFLGTKEKISNIDPEKFHERFAQGKSNLFAKLNLGAKGPEEEKIINAIKKRVQYYGYAYAKQRANARTEPFIEEGKKAA